MWIAAINGHCLAGGFGIAITCDFRIASTNADFAAMGVKRGLVTSSHQSQTLIRIIPFAYALQMLLLGERVDAQEAYRIGLVHKVVPPTELMPEAKRWATIVSENAPLAVQWCKELAYHGRQMPWEEAIRYESELFHTSSLTEDAREGFVSFLEKRKPVWKEK